MADYIKLPRAILTDNLWRDGNLARLYLYLLSKADYNGCIETTSGELERDTGLSRQQQRTLLSELKTTNKLTKQSTNKSTNISLCGIASCIIGQPTRQPTRQPKNQPTVISDTSSDALILEPYVDPQFAEAWGKWLEYRREVKRSYKSKVSARTAYCKMVKMANDDPAQAMDMVDRAILGQWQGLHETKQYGTTRLTTTSNDFASRAESRRRMSALASEIVSRDADTILNLYNGQGQ